MNKKFLGIPNKMIVDYLHKYTKFEFTDGSIINTEDTDITRAEISSLYSGNLDYTNIRKIKLSQNLASYEINAFNNISALEHISIPFLLTCGKFYGMYNLSSISTNELYFDKYGNKLECLNVETLVSPFIHTGSDLYKNTTLSTSLYFPNTTTITINRSTKYTTCFAYRHYNLQILDFPKLTSIKYDANRCFGLLHMCYCKRIHVPQLTNICEYFLRNCGSETVTCYIDFRGRTSNILPELPAGTLTPFHKSYFKIIVDNGKKSLWTRDADWSVWSANIIEDKEYNEQ